MSNEKTKVNMDPKYIIKLTVTLFVTCVIVAGLLGGVNAITKDKIAAINWEKTVQAMKAVVADPDSTTFSDALENTAEMEAACLAGGATLQSVYEVQVNGAAAGYAIKVSASGCHRDDGWCGRRRRRYRRCRRQALRDLRYRHQGCRERAQLCRRRHAESVRRQDRR